MQSVFSDTAQYTAGRKLNLWFNDIILSLAHYATDYGATATTSTPRCFTEQGVSDYYPTYSSTISTTSPAPAISAAESSLTGSPSTLGTLPASYGSYTAYYGGYAPQTIGQQHHHHSTIQTGAPNHTLTPQLTSSPLLTTPDIQETKEDKDGNPTYDWMKIRRNPPKTTRK